MRHGVKLTAILIAVASFTSVAVAQQLDPELALEQQKRNAETRELQARQAAADEAIQRDRAVAAEQLARALVEVHQTAAKTEKAAYLGVALEPLDPARRDELKLAKRVGVTVNHVEPGSPAEQGGIMAGDVLQKLNDQILFDMYQVTALVRSLTVGDEAKLTIFRDKQTIVVAVKPVEKEMAELEDPNVPRPLQVIGLPANQLVDPHIAPFVLDGIPNVGTDLVETNRGLLALAQGNGNRPPKVPPGRLDAITWSDDEHLFEVTATSDPRQRARELHLVVKNIDGTFLFDGPINTPDEQKALPKDVAEKLQAPNVTAILDFMRGITRKDVREIRVEPLRR